MTQQIQNIIDSMSEDDYYEDDAVILKNYIERIERDQFITDEANKGLGRIIVDLKNYKELLKNRILELLAEKEHLEKVYERFYNKEGLSI